MTQKLSKAQVRRMQSSLEQILANARTIEGKPAAPERAGTPKHNEIHLANESVFIQDYFDEPLTQYAVGWRDPNNIQATVDFFAPAVQTPRRFTYKEWNNIEEFLSEGANDDLRAIDGEFARVKYTGTETHSKTDNRGLTIRVDLDEVADPDSVLAGGLPAYQAKAVDKIKRRLLRNTLRRIIALISAGATNTAKTWDTTAGKDPDQDVLSELILGNTASGIRPNRVGYGDTAWSKRVLAHRGQNNAGGYASAGMTSDQVGAFLRAQTFISEERYSASGSALSEILGNLVLMFFAMGADTEDPSNVKRFVTPCGGGLANKVYVQQVTAKLIDISVEHYELIKLTSALGLRKFTIS